MNITKLKQHFAMIKEGVPENELPKLDVPTEEVILFLVNRVEELERQREVTEKVAGMHYVDGFGWE